MQRNWTKACVCVKKRWTNITWNTREKPRWDLCRVDGSRYLVNDHFRILCLTTGRCPHDIADRYQLSYAVSGSTLVICSQDFAGLYLCWYPWPLFTWRVGDANSRDWRTPGPTGLTHVIELCCWGFSGWSHVTGLSSDVWCHVDWLGMGRWLGWGWFPPTKACRPGWHSWVLLRSLTFDIIWQEKPCNVNPGLINPWAG